MNEETTTIEQREPLPLESLAPLPVKHEAGEWEKGKYWNNLLTGDLSAVPDSVRLKAGAADAGIPPEEREYRLAANINRSWVVDYRNKSREEVSRAWPELRREMAAELGAADSEAEVYQALSLKHQDAPLRQQVRRLFQKHYQAAIQGKPEEMPEHAAAQNVCRTASAYARQTVQEYTPLAENVLQGWAAMNAEETKVLSLPDTLKGVPGLVEAVDALADMELEERYKVYAIARSLDSAQKLKSSPQGVFPAMLQNMRRGAADLRYSVLQGVGHVAAALTKAAAETLDSDTLRQGVDAADKRLQVLHELRTVAQDEVFPIKLEEESSLLEEMAVDAAGALPGAALAFMGGAGFGVLSLAGTGAAVAEARRRSPQGRQEMQTAAGIVGGAIQGGIYMAMSRIGAQMLNKTINAFLHAGQSGVKGYSLAALKSLGTLTAENAKLLLAGKLAHAAELSMQELAARVDNVASHIDWQEFGDNIVDIETNMREAAINLPYVLIAAGRAALHHFRAPDALVANRALLEDWGIPEADIRRIQEQPDIHARTRELREALSHSRRWGGAGMLELCVRSLRLLNTETHTAFKDAETVRHFLNLPSEQDSLPAKQISQRNLSSPEALREVNALMNGRPTDMLNVQQCIPFIRLWDEWNQKAFGEWIRVPEHARMRAEHYLNQRKDPHRPDEVKLEGDYTPYREEMARVVMRDQMRELLNLSYQYLMNRESPDSLRLVYKSEHKAREKSEVHRKALLSELLMAMEKGMRSGEREAALDAFSRSLEETYMTRRRVSTHIPLWMRKTREIDFRDGYQKSLKQVLRNKKSTPRELIETYRIMLGLRSCASVLMDVIPMTPDFQELLKLGHSPEDAFSHLLYREMKSHIDPEIWNPPALPDKTSEPASHAGREKLFAAYEMMSGNHLESSPDGSGKMLWRARRPDGKYTPWLDSPAQVVNSVSGNVQTRFLPVGTNLLLENIRQAYGKSEPGSRYFLHAFVNPPPNRIFTGFEHLGQSATRDLCSLWLGNATQYSLGLEFAATDMKWNRHKGRRVEAGVKNREDSHDAYLAKQGKMDTPLSLARLRFLVYWQRMLSSGWVDAEQVGRTLLDAGVISRKALDTLLDAGKDRKLNPTRFNIEKRRRLQRLYPDGMVPGDMPAVHSELARHMADLNVLYMLANLPSARVPDSVREWYYTCPFTEEAAAHEGRGRVHAMVRKNRADAESVKKMLPEVKRLRNLQTPLKLAEMMQDAYQPGLSRRYEQGWCFAVGGNSAFRSTGQSHWNLLENPARGWKLLTPEDRESLLLDIRDLCQGREPELALQELTDVLQQYPGLRAYSCSARHGGQLQRMELADDIPSLIPEPAYARWEDPMVQRPVMVEQGYAVKDAAELPPEWNSDPRVLPALQLLTELRRSVSASPYADEQGIWWKKENYGGLHGKRPNGIDSRWVAEAGLSSFMKFYKRTAEMGDAYGAHGKLNVCGVPLGGIHETDVEAGELNRVTVYRNPVQPEHMVRLMPGAPNASNPYQRKPYVVHTADGIPLFPARMARSLTASMQAMTPLNTFNSDLGRAYDFTTNHSSRRRQVEAHLTDLLKRRALTPDAWYKADASRINNAELFMQLFQDGRLSYFLENRDPSTLTRGEALSAELGRLLLLAEFGTNREKRVEELVAFCRKLSSSREDLLLLKTTMSRVVSPSPNRYQEEELPRPEEDRELDLDPEDAEYY